MAAETFRITEELVVEDRTGPGFESARRKVSQFDRTLQETQSRLNKMTGSRWNVAFNAVDKATSVITKAESKIKSVAGKAWNFTVGVVDKATAPLQGIFNMLRNPILQAGAVLGISLSASDAINTFGAFEATMSKVKAISGASGEDFEALTALAKEMGATTKFTAQEAAEGLTYMAMAGWKTEDMLASLSGIMDLAAASGEDLATVSDIVTDAMTAFGMSASGYTENGIANATHFADVLAVASSSANTNVAMMGETFKYVGAASGALGYSIEDVALGIGLMANSGIKASQAGTELNSIFTRLGTNTNGARDAIEEMGISFYTSTGDAREFGDVLGELRAATRNMTQEQKINFANTVAGQRAQAGFLAMLNATEEDYAKLTDAIQECDGAAEAMADEMMNNLQGSMQYLSSAADGVKMTLGSRLSPYLREFVDWLTTKMPDVEAAINRVMDVVDEKVAQLKSTIAEFTSSDEWANADVWGKIAIAWDKIVAEPFSQWWESSGKPWLTEKVAAFGETLGSGITAGLLAILGFDESGAIADGMTIGKSFLDGFKSGLDMDKISEAFTEWAGDHKGVIAAAGLVAGGKLLGGAAKAFQAAKGLFGGTSGGGGGGGLGSFVSTMTVSAGTVIVNGGMASNAANAVRTAASGGGLPALPGAAGGGRLALPGPAGGTAAAGGLTSAGSWLGKLLTMGSSSSVVGADGTLLAVQGGIGGTLGSVGGALGSGATTAAGAAAAGTAAIGGGLLGGAGIISGLIDIFKGTQTTGKEAQDNYVTGGTKIGMVGAGAAAGAAIGSVVPVVGTGVGAFVGAGIGGLAALFGGDGIGKMLSDALDEGGLLNNAGKAIGGFFTETLPNFVTKSIPAAISSAGEAIGGFASSVGEIVGGFFTETIPTFLTEQVPYAVGYVVGAAQVFFTETVPGAVGDMLQTVGTFFTETVPAWAEGVAQRATTFFTETVPAAVGNLLQNVGNFFTETLPTWAEGVGQRAAVFFGETVPTFFSELFTNVGTFFTETIPEWATGAFDAAATFFTEDVPQFIGDLWDNVTGFVTETIPAWGKSIGDKVSGWWDSISGWFGDLWDGISGAFSSGKEAGSAAAGKHAEGGIMHAPHMAQVAEDGPEAIIPLGASSRSRGMAVWEEAGDILGVNSPAPVGSNDNGLGDIIPEGNGGAYSGPQGGGNGKDVPAYPTGTPGTRGPAEGQGEPAVTVPVTITINPEIVIQAAAQGMSPEDIVALLKEKIRDMVDDISDEMAEKLARIFANMPVRGGA